MLTHVHVQHEGQDVLQIALQNNTYCLQTYRYPAAIPAVWSLVQFLRQDDHHTRPQTVMIAHPCIYGQIMLSLLIDSLAPTVRVESQFNINCTRHMCPTYIQGISNNHVITCIYCPSSHLITISTLLFFCKTWGLMLLLDIS